MFKVQNDYGKVYTVFAVRDYDGTFVQEPKFLIYKDNKWEWVWASDYKPYFE